MPDTDEMKLQLQPTGEATAAATATSITPKTNMAKEALVRNSNSQKLAKEIFEDERPHPTQSKRQVEQESKDMLQNIRELNIQMKVTAENIRKSDSTAEH